MGLFEIHEQAPDRKGFRRYQIIRVVRADRETEYRKDLGPAKKFAGIPQIRIPGGVRDEVTGRIDIVETVGRLRDIADSLRASKGLDKHEVGQSHAIRAK